MESHGERGGGEDARIISFKTLGFEQVEAADRSAAQRAIRPAVKQYVNKSGAEVVSLSQPRWQDGLCGWVTWGKCGWHANCEYRYKGVLAPGGECEVLGAGVHSTIPAPCRRAAIPGRPTMSKAQRAALKRALGWHDGESGSVLRGKRPREAAGELINTEEAGPPGKAVRKLKYLMLNKERVRPSLIDVEHLRRFCQERFVPLTRALDMDNPEDAKK
eukprot:2894092-Karenia_brevis.AAC.1